MLSKKKKIIILSSMLVLLVVTGWLNIVLTNGKTVDAGTGGTGGTGNFFIDSRTNRLEIRNQTILILDSIIANDQTDAESLAEATRQKLFLTEVMNQEPELEMLIAAREGIDDCLVTIGSSNISVIVKCEEYDDQIISQIYSIIRDKTGKTARYVNITPI